jgi:DNA-binding CsgD family transcriptional regulator
MDEVELVSRLIGDIYDAALDRNLWQSVLQKTCEFVRGQTAMLVAAGSVQVHLYFQWGHEPRFIEAWDRTYQRINPAQVPVMAMKVGEIKTVAEFMPYEEWLASRFYREWIAPQGLGDGMYGLFEKSATSHAGVAVIKSARDGPIDDEAKRRFRLLYPHFRRAVTFGRIIDLHKFEAAALADSLDGLAAAVLLVDANGSLVHANKAGQAMLEAGAVIRVAANRLNAVDRQADGVLRDIFAAAAKGDEAVSTKGIDVPLVGRNGERYVAHVLPLTSGARRAAGLAYSAVAAVFIHKAELDLPHPLEALAVTFTLTPAEMRVLMMIVQLGGPREVAPVLGISEPTVKTHLQHIFEKTDTSRQADLVKLVAGYMSPLAGHSAQ